MAVYHVMLSNGTMAEFTRISAALHRALDFTQGPRMAKYEVRIEDDASVYYSACGRWAAVRIAEQGA